MQALILAVLLACQLMAPTQEARLRRMIPPVSDAALRRVLDDKRLLLYTEREMPRCYQDWSGALLGIHSAYNNVSAAPGESRGNMNAEHPWNRPGGTDRCTNVTEFRFIWLPSGKPIAWYTRMFPENRAPAYAWTFPRGSIVGEVLMMRSPSGQRHTFELRIRKREYAEWAVDVFRPFSTRHALSRRIKDLRPQWRDNPQLSAAVLHLEDDNYTMPVTSIRDSHPRVTFASQAGIDSLPSLGDDSLVSELLTKTTFESCLGAEWRRAKLSANAASTEAIWHIVPTDYDATFITVDRSSCMDCHNSSLKHVNTFDSSRDWYGASRSVDGIFSFHVFDRSSISHNGSGRPVMINPSLVRAGIVERYDARKHNLVDYQRIPGVR